MGGGGRSGWQPRPRPSLGGGRGAGLLLPRHGDGPLAVAGIHARRDLGAGEGQHAVRRQRAGECGLVHVGRQAVAAVELAGDVAVVILGDRGRARSETPPQRVAAASHRGGHPGPHEGQTHDTPTGRGLHRVQGSGTALHPCIQSGLAWGPWLFTIMSPQRRVSGPAPGPALGSSYPCTSGLTDCLGSGPCHPSSWVRKPCLDVPFS